MPTPTFSDTIPPERLSATLKAVRKARNLKAKDVAAAMLMASRSYERFEAGEGEFSFAKVRRFAEVTRSDPFGILFAVLINSPGFAVSSAANRLTPLFLLTLEEFDSDEGEGIALLDGTTILRAFSDAFRTLAAEIARRKIVEPPDETPSDPSPPSPAVDDNPEDP